MDRQSLPCRPTVTLSVAFSRKFVRIGPHLTAYIHFKV